MDALKNFATSTVATAPSPATSGTSLVVASGTGSLFPTAPFYATVWPASVQPLASNAEIVRVTAVTTDTFTITRAQDGSTAQSITAGYQIAQTVNAGLLLELAALSGATFTGAVSGTTATWSGEDKASDFAPTGLTGATTASRYVGGTSAGAPTTGTFSVGDWVIDQQATIWVCVLAGTPGTWSPVPAQTVVLRSATATANLGEFTIFQGSTSSQTISFPFSGSGHTPPSGSTFTIKNEASVTVTIADSSQPFYISGTSYTSYVIPINCAYEFVYGSDGAWHCSWTTDPANLGNNSLPISKGGTGSSSITTDQIIIPNQMFS